ncbi:hypothetical protein CBM2623_B30229 [Cupriavidus taiwanensis]|nr:hypothetical protein CBM2623_B30229 [Cupriavidus taiwanensis]
MRPARHPSRHRKQTAETARGSALGPYLLFPFLIFRRHRRQKVTAGSGRTLAPCVSNHRRTPPAASGCNVAQASCHLPASVNV